MKKIFCLLLCAFLIWGAVPFASSAKTEAETVEEGVYVFDGYNAAYENASVYSGSVKKYAELLDKMVLAIKNLEDDFELIEYNIYLKDLNELIDNLFVYEPDLFYLGSKFSYSYDRETNRVLDLQFEYLYPKAEIIAKKAEYDGFIESLVKMRNPAWTDFETLLFYHDYIVVNFQYDFTYTIGDVYNLYKTGKGVCQAYANLYRDILDELGYETTFVANKKIMHGWAGVKLDGKWYCVDPTWSDSVIDGSFYAHNNFLFSEKNAGEHIVDTPSEWEVSEYGASFKSTSYDNFLWTDVNSAFVYADDFWYFVGGNCEDGYFIYKTDDFRKRMPVFELTETEWHTADGASFYVDCFSSISLYKGKLIVTDNQKVFVYDPKTDTLIAEKTLVAEKGRQIFGSRTENNILHYTLCKDLSSENLEDVRLGTYDLDLLFDEPEKTVEKVEIESLPKKLTFYHGERFSSDGLALKVTYTDSTFDIVTSGIEIKGFDSSVVGKITVKALYAGFEVPFEVEIEKEAKPEVGDIDGDGSISLNDAMFIIFNVAKKDNSVIPAETFYCWDTDRDGCVSLNDAMYVILYVAKKSDHVGP